MSIEVAVALVANGDAIKTVVVPVRPGQLKEAGTLAVERLVDVLVNEAVNAYLAEEDA